MNISRHGTLSLTVNFEVSSGKVEASAINETRTETDFSGHIEKRVEEPPEGEEMVVHCRSIEHAQVGKFGEISGRKRRHQGVGVRRKREKRDFADDENKAEIPGK